MKTKQSGKHNTAPDVRKILRGVRGEILSSCHIVFSRVFPKNVPRPESHPLWKMATSMGAICHTNLNPKITHVVAIDKSTDKAVWAKDNCRHLVHPSWVEASYFLWKSAREESFPVGRVVERRVEGGEKGEEKGGEEREEEGGVNGEGSTSSMSEFTEGDVVDTAHMQESEEGKQDEREEEGKKEEEKEEVKREGDAESSCEGHLSSLKDLIQTVDK